MRRAGCQRSEVRGRVLHSAFCILHSAFLFLAFSARAHAQRSSASGPESRSSLATSVPYAIALRSEPDAPPVPREFRGAWIATVDNIDWPSKQGLSVDSQKAELLALLDHSAAIKLNAIIFQVRPAADAFYTSSLEPWSVYLTGRNGKAPDPDWDPLAFAVAESHRRGLELHAWFNPYRAKFRGDRGTLSSKHVSRTMPKVVKQYGPYLWMDPGEPSVRAHTTKVIVDVVRRYDIDGVHIDDYFYPYPENDRRGREIPFPDDASWKAYQRTGGKLDRDDWRRHNVDLLVEQLYREIKKTKPWVKFGVSPFGIWRPGYPESVRGLDAYTKLFADSKRWLEEGWVDYFTPQLYWAIGAQQQSYPELLEWWAGKNKRGRHLWPGNGTYKVANYGSVRWPANEILQQVTLTRDQTGAGGNVHYNMGALVTSADGLAEKLSGGPYAEPALVPASPWLSNARPGTPIVTVTRGAQVLTVKVSVPGGRTITTATPRWWLVRARYADGWHVQVADARLPSVSVERGATGAFPDYLVVNAIDRAGIESEGARFVVDNPTR